KAWRIEMNDVFNKMLKWNFVGALTDRLISKSKRTSTKNTTSSSGKRLSMNSLKEANWAGGKRSSECILFLTEGDSAKTFAEFGIGATNNHDIYGALALRGKVLNVMNASRSELSSNKEIRQMKTVLGLQEGVDYKDDENFKKLRYGGVWIMTDADDDGIHIKGLILIFFYTFWPELFARGYIKAFNTAVVQVTQGKNIVDRFYSSSAFEKWAETADTKNYKFMYLKGLGSIYPSDIPSYFNDKKIVNFFLEGDEKPYVDVGFGKENSEDRKEWMIRDMSPSTPWKGTNPHSPEDCEDMIPATPRQGPRLHFPGEDEDEDKNFNFENSSEEEEEEEEYEEKIEGDLPFSEFIDVPLRDFHISTLKRALPDMSGLKEVQKKALFGIRSKNYKEEKIVAQVVGEACVESGYHHGSKSMEDTVIKMAQDFVGSMNNLPFLKQGGSFGSRTQGGNDAAASRYIRTRLEDITKIIFDPADDPILERLVQDGVKVEYRFFAPIVPMVLINGAKGIATGFSTEIPCYNPYDIVKWIKTWLLDRSEVENFEYLVPYHNNFTGEIELTFDDKNKPPTGYISKGLIEPAKKKGWWKITELPLGVWTQTLEEKLGYFLHCTSPEGKKWKKLEKNKVLDYNNYSTPNSVDYEIKPTKDFDIESWDILTKKHSLKNLVIIDDNSYPHRFNSAEEILHHYCSHRLDLYKQRKEYQLYQLEKDLCKASNKIKFIEAVYNEEINFENEEGDQTIEDQLDEMEFTRVDGTFDYLTNISIVTLLKKSKADQLRAEETNLEQKIKDLESRSPEDLWMADLKTFKKAYTKYLKERY
ncbi:hypothetical protein OAG24_01220, partial [bacterium]|nr:hypothetical protein [bacterium]